MAHPPFKWQFHRFLLWLLIFSPYSESSYLADQLLANLTPFKWQFHRFLLYPESSYLADHVVANLPPFIWQFHTFLLWLLIFLSYSKSSTCGRPGLGRSNPSQISISQILALLWELVFGRPGLGRTTPISKGNSTDSCSTLRVHIWQKSVYRSTHPLKWQFHRFLLWMLIFLSYSKSSSFGRPVLGRSIHPSNGSFTDSCSTLRVHIWQTNCWEIYSHLNGNFTDSTSDCSYFILPLRAQHLAGHGLAHLPLFQMAISQIPGLTAHISFLLWEFNIWQTRS